ncbi:glycosyltransferase family protein [Loigolactobacillus binensis]|uniref:Integral membrane protein n=1 Tax=Loigolactobacillus binensis TaxID=2559922 RepID=A0ABW3EHR4_9LACO|nr:hypothetical protein [Loigolactobacillus binensis]
MQIKLSKMIDRILLAFFFLTFAGTLASNNLNGQILGWGIVYLLLIDGLLVVGKRYLPAKGQVLWSAIKRVFKSKWLLIGLTGVYQISLIYTLAGETGFDTGIVKWGAQSTSIPAESYLYNYFSHYPNNLGLLFFERLVYRATKFFGLTNYTIVLDVINLLAVDIALILISFVLRQQLKRTVRWVLLPLILLLSPWIVIVYTDTLILPFIAGIILLLNHLFASWQTEAKINFNLMGQASLLGLITWSAYRLKPNALIIVLAFLIELGLVLWSKQVKIKPQKLLVTAGLFVIFFGGCQLLAQNKLKHQTFVPINSAIQELPSHFIMMGMNKATTGGYSQADFLYSTQYPTQASQQKANFKRIRQRFGKFGVLGYLKFLVVKNYANTSDGTLGWLNEGDFFSKPNLKKHAFMRSFFYNFGSRLTIQRTIDQVLWILIMLGVVFSFLERSFLCRVLRMTFFGLLVFLLFFEGGRARYMIQFLPVIYSLAVVGWWRTWQFLHENKFITCRGLKSLPGHHN